MTNPFKIVYRERSTNPGFREFVRIVISDGEDFFFGFEDQYENDNTIGLFPSMETMFGSCGDETDYLIPPGTPYREGIWDEVLLVLEKTKDCQLPAIKRALDHYVVHPSREDKVLVRVRNIRGTFLNLESNHAPQELTMTVSRKNIIEDIKNTLSEKIGRNMWSFDIDIIMDSVPVKGDLVWWDDPLEGNYFEVADIPEDKELSEESTVTLVDCTCGGQTKVPLNELYKNFEDSVLKKSSWP